MSELQITRDLIFVVSQSRFNSRITFKPKYLYYLNFIPVFYHLNDKGILAAKVQRQDSLARFLSQRPQRQELLARNILQTETERDRVENRQIIGAKLNRYGERVGGYGYMCRGLIVIQAHRPEPPTPPPPLDHRRQAQQVS